MTKTSNFLWIDDDPDRVKNFETLITQRGSKKVASLEVFSVKNLDVVTQIPEILKKNAPDLLIIDHVFSNAGGNSLREGSTVAAALRERWTGVPIVGVSAALRVAMKQKHFDRLKTAEYIELFDWDAFNENIPELFVISRDFKILLANKLDKPEKYLKFLDCRVDPEILISVLPSEFKSIPDASTPHTFARWTIHKFMQHPGFLYDKARTATFLGLSEKGFVKVKSRFDACMYAGVFCSPVRQRWWPKLVRAILYKTLPKETANLPWVSGRNLPGIKKADFSECYLCKDGIPETMAYPDAKSEDLFPVCLKHTIPHPRSTTTIGFEELRIFKPM
jgi:hypothetical protein